MENYKVKVNGNIEELISLFSALGCKYFNHTVTEKNYMLAEDGKVFFCKLKSNFKKSACQEVTIDQLRDMVVLKRNDISDATHCTESCSAKGFLSSEGIEYFWDYGMKEWNKHKHSNFAEYQMKPITKEPVMKEFLNKLEDGTYKLVLLDSVADGVEGLIEVPEGANSATCGTYGDITFFNDFYFPDGRFKSGVIIWQRETQSEALPFIDDEPKYDPEDIGIAKGYDLDELAKEYKLRDRCDGETDEEYRYMLKHCIDLENYIAKETLNDKVASAEVARQKSITPFDTQISGDHYKLLPIQPMKFALANGLDYAQGNVIKYVIRHASKNGKDDLLKAIHNIELMIEHYYG